MEKKVTLGYKQHITLKTGFSEGWYYHYNICLNSFNTCGHRALWLNEEEAVEEGMSRIHQAIQDHMEESKTPMSEMDQELIIKFFEEQNIEI